MTVPMLGLMINGKSHQVDVSPETPLLWVLRDVLGMTGTKFGWPGRDVMRTFALPVLGLLVVAAAACSRSEAAQVGDPGLFEPIASVLTHPRCINCHQDDSPRQTDAKIRHLPLVVRGADGHGAPTQQCQTCHQTANTAAGIVPGAKGWALAPLSMLWEGRTPAQICEQIKDPARNGGRRSGEEVIEHMKVDPLVLWAWTPGPGRTTPPLWHEKFVEVLEAWVKAGMPCPR